jgi:polyphosphate kinase
VFIFYNGGEEKYFISSADWMGRNFDFRSEIAVPVYDPEIKKQLKDIIDILWADNTKARILGSDQSNEYRRTHSKNKVRAQDAIYKLFTSKHN